MLGRKKRAWPCSHAGRGPFASHRGRRRWHDMAACQTNFGIRVIPQFHWAVRRVFLRIYIRGMKVCWAPMESKFPPIYLSIYLSIYIHIYIYITCIIILLCIFVSRAPIVPALRSKPRERKGVRGRTDIYVGMYMYVYIYIYICIIVLLCYRYIIASLAIYSLVYSCHNPH